MAYKIIGAIAIGDRVFRAGSEAEMEAAAKAEKLDLAKFAEEGGPLESVSGGAAPKRAEGLDGLNFASDEAAEGASNAGLVAADFDGMEPSGAGGFTAADVKKAVSAKDGK